MSQFYRLNVLDAVIPVIQTERLILRGAEPRDFDTYLKMMECDHHSSKLTTEDVWRKFTSATGLWLLLRYGYWSIEQKDGGDFIGRAGFGEFRRGLKPSIDGIPEIGWRIRPDLWGRGYASEAVSACLEWADKHLSQKVVAIIESSNRPSVRLAAKAGFDGPRTATYNNTPILLFERHPKN
jgi:RimJ/RimL family protein N-acetyltransferase